MSTAFVDVSLIIVLAAALGILAHTLKQPTIVAYLAAGIIVSAFGILNLNSTDVLHVMATFGITFLLFLVGLEMRFSELKSLGRVIIIAGIGQIALTGILGFALSLLLGFSVLTSFYIASALSFSSTIIVVKLISEKRDLQSLYGRIVVGILLLQDVIAMMLLIILTGMKTSDGIAIDIQQLIIVIAKAALLFGGTLWVSRRVIPKYIERIAHSPEIIFIGSVAWAFGIALFVSSPLIGFSIEIGGFLAGLSLAQSAEQFQINSRIRPLRDFFIVIFFIMLGSSLAISHFSSIIIPIVILSLFVLVIKPIIVMLLMGHLGYKKITSFFTGVSLAQVSEFSLILIAVGKSLGHLNDEAVSVVTVIAIMTIIGSTYMITKINWLYERLRHLLTAFETGQKQEKNIRKPLLKNHTILIGAHRLGQYLLPWLKPSSAVIVEFDPEIVKQLRKKGYNVLFGDIADPEIAEQVHIEAAVCLVSTIPGVEQNIALLKHVQALPKLQRPFCIVNAHQEWQAKMYYTQGADYVLLPYFVAAQHIRHLVKNGAWNFSLAQQYRKKEIAMLQTT